MKSSTSHPTRRAREPPKSRGKISVGAKGVQVRPLQSTDRDEWLELRSQLWDDHDPQDLAAEADGFLQGWGFGRLPGGPLPAEVLLAVDPAGRILGFIEVDVRQSADGCSSPNVGYLEGWYVKSGARRAGIGSSLVRAAEDWARSHGCSEMASDTLSDNRTGELAHQGVGYEEVHRLIHYRRKLD